MPPDTRLQAFLTEGCEVFSSIQQGQYLWQPDPFDVETFNAPARRTFRKLLERATAPTPPDTGKMLLLLGESGCGKTHLVRAFRNHTHAQNKGFVGYMPMTVDASHYDRYILSNLIDSLDHPYDLTTSDDSGLMRLSDALMKHCKSVFAPLIPDDKVLDEDELHSTVHQVADELLSDPRFRGVEVDLLRALLYLQRKEPRITRRIFHWLRCEDLSAADRAVIGELIPRTADDAPMRMVEHLGRLLAALGQALVLCVDQVEDLIDFEERPNMESSFRRAMNSLVAIASRVPTAIVVICCLEDYWRKTRPRITRSMLDRLENDPEPVQLERTVTAEIARDMATRRLNSLYAQRGADFDPANPTFPIPPQGFELLSGFRARDVLEQCRKYRDQAIQHHRLPVTFPLPESSKDSKPNSTPVEPHRSPATPDLDQAWIDFRNNFRAKLPEDASDLAMILAWAIEMGSDELAGTTRFTVLPKDETALEVTVRPDGKRLFIALCERDPRGGGLGKQMEQMLRAAAGRTPVFVRTSEFPARPGGLVAEQLGLLNRKGGRRALLGDSDLRELVAMRAFRQRHAGLPTFLDWSRKTRPITRLKAIGDILKLEMEPPTPLAPAPPPSGNNNGGGNGANRESLAQTPASSTGPQSVVIGATSHERTETHTWTSQDTQVLGGGLIVHVDTITNLDGPALPQPSPPMVETSGPTRPLRLGVSEGFRAQLVTVDPDELTKHSAFLGGAGSGKTTLALNVIEQLLLKGIPALLVDRKGDLASYANPAAWEEDLSNNPELAERRRLLRERVEVALYTPGRSDGRPLAIPVVPRGLDLMGPEEREQGVQQAADALASMLDYRPGARDKTPRVLLTQAVRLLVQSTPGADLTLDMLHELVDSRDPTLVQEARGLDAKAFPKLAHDLAVLRINLRPFLSSDGDRLDLGELLGHGSASISGRTRLSIISTKFLGDNSRILFWVSQLLLETARWASQTPSPQLQAALFFDEADLYLPAIGQPATKQPMENLLKRARSAGIGMMLATQSPGDLDYRCRENIRTWCAGRVKEDTALKKLRPMFSDSGVDVMTRLPPQKQGQFHVLRDGLVQQIRADRSIMRTEQLSEDAILRFARLTLEQSRH